MSFFNKKEEVLQIKLTQYGKHLLSKGKFNPTYYAFFDDSVLYDTEWAFYEEHQNEAEERIQDNTPSLKVQHIFAGAETNIKKLTKNPATALQYWEKDLPYSQHTEDKHYSIVATPLGRSSYGIQEAPSFTVNFLIGEMTGSSYYLTGSHQTLKIPQLDIDLTYETSFSFEEDAPQLSNILLRGPAGIELGGTFPDGSKINVTEKHLLLEIVENNTEFSNKNFDIEVYEIEEEEVNNYKTPGIDSPRKKFNLLPLSFIRPRENIINNILLDPIEEENDLDLNLDSTYIRHYFDIYADGGIDSALMCSASTGEKVEEMYDEFGFECPEDTGTGTTNEDSNVFNDNDQEACD